MGSAKNSPSLKITKQTPNYIVFDDFLSPTDFSFVWNYIQSIDFQYVHHEKWIKAFRLEDGQALWADPVLSHQNSIDKNRPTFPTGLGIDAFMAAMIQNLDSFKDYCGRKDADWEYFFCRPYIYPKGAGLNWHSDGRDNISGAFVYYAHPEWRANWGAELLIDESEHKVLSYPKKEMYGGKQGAIGLHIDNDASNAMLMDHGIGSYIVPKPNRLILIKVGALHRITPVHEAAGDRVRASLTGFFINKK